MEMAMGPLGAKIDPAARRAREKKRKLARGLRRGILLVLLLGAAVSTVLALRPRPVPVDVARVVRGPLVTAIEEKGMTRVIDRYLVSAPVTGNVARVTLEPGDAVREGDALVEIVPVLSPLLDERARAEAEANLSAALSTLGQAKAQTERASVARARADQDLVRDRELIRSGSIAPQALEQTEFEARMRAQELASAEFATRVAEEQARAARAVLGQGGAHPTGGHHVDVVAPVSGKVLKVQQKSAGVVQAGSPLLEVGDPTALEVVVDLLTQDAVHVEPGTPVTIERWGGDWPLAGRVRRVEPSAFTRPSALGVDEQRVNVIVALTEPRDAHAVELATILASRFESKMTLLHVFYLPPLAYANGIYVPLDELMAEADRTLSNSVAKLKATYPRVEGLLVSGVPWERILSVAKEQKCDLIAMGTHGRRGFSRIVLGSVAERIVRMSPVPVLTVG